MIRTITVCLCIISATLSIDYCSKFLCRGKRSGFTHIACNNYGKLGENCPDNTSIIGFTKKLKDLVLNVHNGHRNEIACGKLEGYEAAVRMATLTWDDELAQFAEYNVRRCIFDHDKCHNTEKFMYVGQNLAQMKNNKRFELPSEISKYLIDAWYGENKLTNMSVIEKYTKTGKTIGHFTQMVRDQAFLVGCAIVQFPDDGWYVTILGCDYSLNNILHLPIYDATPKKEQAASKCETGTNPEFECLCSTNEIYDNPLFYT